MSSVKAICHLLESLEWLSSKIGVLAETLSTNTHDLTKFWTEVSLIGVRG